MITEPFLALEPKMCYTFDVSRYGNFGSRVRKLWRKEVAFWLKEM